MCVCAKLRNATSVFVLYRARQSTTCSLVKNDKLGRTEGGGGVRRDDRERTDVEGEKKTEKTKVLKVAKLGEREAGNRKEDEKKV